MSRRLGIIATLAFLMLLSCVHYAGDPMESALPTAAAQDDAVVINEGSIRVRVERRARLALATEINLLRQSIYAFYSPSIAPYPGAISKQVKCDDRYRYTEVVEKAGDFEFSGFKLYANKRYTLGACLKSEVEFTAYRGLVVCPDGARFEMWFFQPFGSSDRFSEYLRRLKCPEVPRSI